MDRFYIWCRRGVFFLFGTIEFDLERNRAACFGVKNQVQSGDAIMTIMDSATAEYEVLTEYCDLAVLPDTFFAQHCK